MRDVKQSKVSYKRNMKRKVLMGVLLSLSLIYCFLYVVKFSAFDSINFSSHYTFIFFFIARPILCISAVFFSLSFLNFLLLVKKRKCISVDHKLIVILIVFHIFSIMINDNYNITYFFYGLFSSYQWSFLVGATVYQLLRE